MSDKLTAHLRIVELIELIKTKTPVMVSDLETFTHNILSLDAMIMELQKSRDNWKTKYYELLAQYEAQERINKENKKT